jgi:hypothetical protein
MSVRRLAVTGRGDNAYDAWWSIDAANRLRERARRAERSAAEARREMAELRLTMRAMLEEADTSCSALVGSGDIDDLEIAVRWDGAARVLEELLDR